MLTCGKSESFSRFAKISRREILTDVEVSLLLRKIHARNPDITRSKNDFDVFYFVRIKKCLVGTSTGTKSRSMLKPASLIAVRMVSIEYPLFPISQ